MNDPGWMSFITFQNEKQTSCHNPDYSGKVFFLSWIAYIYLRNCHLNQANRHFEQSYDMRRLQCAAFKANSRRKYWVKNGKYRLKHKINLFSLSITDSQQMKMPTSYSHKTNKSFRCIYKIRSWLSTAYHSLVILSSESCAWQNENTHMKMVNTKPKLKPMHLIWKNIGYGLRQSKNGQWCIKSL